MEFTICSRKKIGEILNTIEILVDDQQAEQLEKLNMEQKKNKVDVVEQK